MNCNGWRRRRSRSKTLIGVAGVALTLLACHASGDERPSFLVVNLDDTRFDGIDQMPELRRRVLDRGVGFENAFAPSPTCCPSRVSLFTGRYALHHGTRHVLGPFGGARSFRESGADRDTIAVWLQRAGYRTGFFGKYLNGYNDKSESGLGPDGGFYRPPGWDRWWAFVSPAHYGGVHGTAYEIVEEDGARSTFGNHADDREYSTDRSAEMLRRFLSDATARGAPFLAYWAPYASHVEMPIREPAPAARHRDQLDGLAPWRPPSWSEPDRSDKPRWVSTHTRNTLVAVHNDRVRQRAYESLLAVDEQLAETLDLLNDLGVDDRTYVLFTSDQGSAWGEHGLFIQTKACPYEECLRIPLVVLDPTREPASPGTRDAVVLNQDVAPTLLTLAGLDPPTGVDGHSLAAWLAGPPPETWRSDFLLEFWRFPRSDIVEYRGQVADGDRLRLWFGDWRPAPRPSFVFEFDADGQVAEGAVRVAMGADARASVDNLADAVRVTLSGSRTEHDVDGSRLKVHASGDHYASVYWWEEVDANDVLAPRNYIPDYFGVRDVANGFTWVEYETGERELYDLNEDPWQLENRADDPDYTAARLRLAARLRELLGEPR